MKKNIFLLWIKQLILETEIRKFIGIRFCHDQEGSMSSYDRDDAIIFAVR